MSKNVRISSRLRRVVAPLAIAAVFSYFGFHLINGDRGLLAYRDLSKKIASAERVKAETGHEREILEHRVSLLRPESLDLDMLEERSRIILDLAAPDDIILFNNAIQ